MPSELTQYKPGEGGRPKGIQNKLTRTVKETVLAAFNQLQGDAKYNIIAFARRYPRDFYNIAAKLIPTEVRADIYTPEGIHLTFESDSGCLPLGAPITGYEAKDS